MESGSQQYLPNEGGFDDLMSNTAGWPANGDQYAFTQQSQQQQVLPGQDRYSPYATNQQNYNHFDLSHQAPQQYQQPVYNASPYSSQYQQLARPSDSFNHGQYHIDPASQSSPGTSYQSAFSFAPQETTTISPHSLQYNAQSIASNQSGNRTVSNLATYQQPTQGHYVQSRPQDPTTQYNNPQSTTAPKTTPQVIIYANSPKSAPQYSVQQVPKATSHSSGPAQNGAPASKLPIPANPLRTTHPELLSAKHSSSRPAIELAPFMRWSDTPVQVAPGLKNTVPKYHPRKSKSGKDIIPGLDVSRISTPAVKKVRIPKQHKLVSKYQGTSQGAKQAPGRLANLRDQGDSTAVKSPSTPTETSSSEEESSSEESEYEEEEEMVKKLHEIRGDTRPTEESAAARYDAIGLVWKDEKMSPSSEVIKDAIDKYGDLVSEIRVQLKDFATKISAAASKPEELVNLTRARARKVDALYQVIETANELGHPHIVENLGTHQKLVVGLTSTLIECSKTKDYAGELPTAIFTLLAKFKTMTDELITKVKFKKIGDAYIKNNKDEQLKKNFAAVLANTVDARARAEKAKQEVTKAEEQKKTLETIERNRTRKAELLKAGPSAKRPHEGDVNGSKPNKKFASDVAGAPVSSKVVPKKPTLTNNLLGITLKPIAKLKPIPKKREPSPPPVSKLGAILDSINEAPKPVKVAATPARPAETPEQKIRRERKESRRHLRVKFKEGPELEEIRLFKHEQAEDEGRQDDMLRDAHDDRSEGMMHKKRVSENLDTAMEDDDGPADDDVEKPYPSELLPVDLSNVGKTTPFGPAYVTRGGEMTLSTPDQQTQKQREELELMVIYTDPKDIPPTPKEPIEEESSGTAHEEREIKGPSQAWILQRLQEIAHFGPKYAADIFAARYHQAKIASAAKPSSNIYSLLQEMGAPHQSSTSQHLTTKTQQPSMDPSILEDLLKTIAPLKDKPYPATEPPEWMSDLTKAEWLEGYRRDKAEADKLALEAQPAPAQPSYFQQPPMISQPQHMASQMAPQMQPQPPAPYQQPAQSGHYPGLQAPQSQGNIDEVTAQVQAYLSGMHNGQIGQIGQEAPQQHHQYDHNDWQAGHLNYDDDPSWPNERSHSKGKQNKSRGQEKKKWGKFGNDGPLDENGEYKGKKRPCVFYAQGKCAKGAKCTFLHDEAQ